jgi:hypothetical protein
VEGAMGSNTVVVIGANKDERKLNFARRKSSFDK